MKPFFVNCQSQHHLAGKILVFVSLGISQRLELPDFNQGFNCKHFKIKQDGSSTIIDAGR